MGFTFKGTHVIDYQNHTLATEAKGYKPPFTSSCGHSVHIHGGGSHTLLANIDLHTCVGRRHSHPSAAFSGGPGKGGGRAGDLYACLYLMNYMQMRWRTRHKRISPQRLWEEGHKGYAFLGCLGVQNRPVAEGA